MTIKAVAAVQLCVALAAGTTASAQLATNCRSYWVGSVLYVSCDGQPGQPAAVQPPRGLDPSIPLRTTMPRGTNLLDSLLKVEQIHALQEQNAAARAEAEQQSLAVASKQVATPAVGAREDDPPVIMNGRWWLWSQRIANSGDQTIKALRVGVVKGIIEGIDLSLMVGAESLGQYQERRAKYMRSDLTVDQLIAKVDGHYAEPANQADLISIALLAAISPQKQ